MEEKLLKEINKIRTMIKEDYSMEQVYNKMIDLNRIDERVDEFTTYFIDSLDLDYDYSSILVEDIWGNYIEATIEDILDTLEEIEYNLIRVEGE